MGRLPRFPILPPSTHCPRTPVSSLFSPHLTSPFGVQSWVLILGCSSVTHPLICTSAYGCWCCCVMPLLPINHSSQAILQNTLCDLARVLLVIEGFSSVPHTLWSVGTFAPQFARLLRTTPWSQRILCFPMFSCIPCMVALTAVQPDNVCTNPA
jgi:hypothetical protein